MEEGVALPIGKEGQTIRSPNINALTAQATLHIPDGQTITLAEATRQFKSGKRRVIMVTPHVLPIGGEKR